MRIRYCLALAVVPFACLVAPAAADAPQLSKAQLEQIKRNVAVLNARLKDNPDAATIKTNGMSGLDMSFSATAAPAGSVDAPVRNDGGATTQAAGTGGCIFSAGAIPQRNFTLPGDPQAIIMHWANSADCLTIPVIMQITTDMIAPNGVHHPAVQVGFPSVDIANTTTGPQGTWNMINTASFAVPSPYIWPGATGFCAGVGTSVVTCFYNYSFPIFLP